MNGDGEALVPAADARWRRESGSERHTPGRPRSRWRVTRRLPWVPGLRFARSRAGKLKRLRAGGQQVEPSRIEVAVIRLALQPADLEAPAVQVDERLGLH